MFVSVMFLRWVVVPFNHRQADAMARKVNKVDVLRPSRRNVFNATEPERAKQSQPRDEFVRADCVPTGHCKATGPSILCQPPRVQSRNLID